MLSLPHQAIGFDVGGTKIAGGVIDASGEVVERLKPVVTPSTGQSVIVDTLQLLAEDLKKRHPNVTAIGVGAAGLINWPQGYIRWAPNNAYRELALRELLEKVTGLPAIVDNDANVAAWAERRVRENPTHMAFLTIGTGVGGGLVLDGAIYRGKTGIAAEVGHMVVDPFGGHRCGCGNIGCLEAVVSGTALGRFGRDAARANPQGLMARLAGNPEKVDGTIVHQAAIEGDPVALRLFRESGERLGVGIANLVNLFDFELIVIGGGLVETGSLLLDPAREALQRFAFAREHRRLPEIVPARLGTDAGWMGSALLALELGRG